MLFMFFFFNDTATTEIYTLSPTRRSSDLTRKTQGMILKNHLLPYFGDTELAAISTIRVIDRKSTRLNSSHLGISYAVFCLKKKKNYRPVTRPCPQCASPYFLENEIKCDGH